MVYKTLQVVNCVVKLLTALIAWERVREYEHSYVLSKNKHAILSSLSSNASVKPLIAISLSYDPLIRLGFSQWSSLWSLLVPDLYNVFFGPLVNGPFKINQFYKEQAYLSGESLGLFVTA